MGYRIHPSVLFTDLDDGTGVLLHLDSKYYYTLNETGSLVWRALTEHEGEGETELASRLAAGGLGVEPGTLTGDIRDLFQEMVREELLVEEA
jgi:hypothetical protein